MASEISVSGALLRLLLLNSRIMELTARIIMTSAGGLRRSVSSTFSTWTETHSEPVPVF